MTRTSAVLQRPSENSTENNSLNDVVGNKNDKSFSDGQENPSLIGHATATYNHIHSPAQVYPTLADAVTVTGSASAWTLETIVEIIPASTITELFDIHWINISNISDEDQYEVVLYQGASGSEEEIGRVRFSRSSNFSQEGNVPIQVPPIDANSRVSAALASKAGGSESCDFCLYYHTYSDVT